jgi:hypothetical protein
MLAHASLLIASCRTLPLTADCADGYKLTATPATQSVVAGAGGTGTADVTITRSPSLAGAALTFGPNPITCTRKGVTDVYTCTNIQPGTNVITVSAANNGARGRARSAQVCPVWGVLIRAQAEGPLAWC